MFYARTSIHLQLALRHIIEYIGGISKQVTGGWTVVDSGAEVKEVTVTASVLRFLNARRGCYAHKIHADGYNPGEPDIDGCIRGRALKVECKRPVGGVLTQRQAAALRRWAIAGAIVGVVTSADDMRRLLRVAGLDPDDKGMGG